MSLQDDLLKLFALDEQATRAAREHDFAALGDMLVEYQSLRKILKTHLLDQPTVLIENVDTAEVFRKICGSEGMATDKLIERLFPALETDCTINGVGGEELEALGSDLFYSWISHYEYIKGLAELRPLVSRSSVANNVSQIVQQAKDCYALQQYLAAYVLCRTLLEACIRDICVRRRLFTDRDSDAILFEKFTWTELRDKVSSGAIRERLQCLYSDLCSVLHARRSVTKDEVRRAIEESLQVVEQLYAAHGL